MNNIFSVVGAKEVFTALLLLFCLGATAQSVSAQTLRVPKITVHRGEKPNPPKELPKIKTPVITAKKGGDACLNPIEPLSNGLKLSMNEAQVNRLLGQPSFKRGALSLFEGGLSVQYGGAGKRIASITISEASEDTEYVKLHCGVTVGTTKEEVVKQFGSLGRYNATISEQYKVEFTFEENRVTKIYVTPGRNGVFK